MSQAVLSAPRRRSPSSTTWPLALALSAFAASESQAAPEPGPRPPRIEVAFALDATGSMGPYIAEARAKIRAIAQDLSRGTPRPDVRFALVAYRDRGDAFVTRVSGFTPDVEAMHQVLDSTEADGGGDLPEALLEGVRDAVTRLAWSPPEQTDVIRLLYVVGDAPAQHYPDGPTEAAVAAEARKRRIAIHGIVCGTAAESAGPEFDSLARHTEGHVFQLGSPLENGAAGARKESLASALTDTTKAYSKSIGVAFGGKDVPALPVEPLDVPQLPTSGIVGSQVRWVKDAASWRDLWEAHTSLVPLAARPPLPSVDFAKTDVLVLGGSAGGIVLDAVFVEKGRRGVRFHAAREGAVRFVLVPVADRGRAG